MYVCISFNIIQLYSFIRTLEERAQRLFSTKGKSLEEIDPTLFTKVKPGKTTPKEKDAEKNRDVAALESQIYRYV